MFALLVTAPKESTLQTIVVDSRASTVILFTAVCHAYCLHVTFSYTHSLKFTRVLCLTRTVFVLRESLFWIQEELL